MYMSNEEIPPNHKRCSKCRYVLSVCFFTKDKSKSDGYHSSCASCKFYPENMDNKKCNICGIEKNLIDDFYAGQGCCKECFKMKQKKSSSTPTPTEIQECTETLNQNKDLENICTDSPTIFCKGRCQKNIPKSKFHKGNNTICRHCIQYHKHVQSRDVYWYLTYLYKSARDRAKKSNIEFSITIDEWYDIYFNQKGLSALSGKSMTHCVSPSLIEYEKYPNNISPDRKDSTKGYTSDNVQFCRWVENSMKNDMTEKDFFERVCEIADFYRNRNNI